MNLSKFFLIYRKDVMQPDHAFIRSLYLDNALVDNY